MSALRKYEIYYRCYDNESMPQYVHYIKAKNNAEAIELAKAFNPNTDYAKKTANGGTWELSRIYWHFENIYMSDKEYELIYGNKRVNNTIIYKIF